MWRASQSFDVMLPAPFFMWNSWKKLTVSKDHLLCHTVRVCFITTAFWHSSAAQGALKKVKKSATKYLLLFPILAPTTTFLYLLELQHGLRCSLCTFKKSEWNSFSPAKTPLLSPSHWSCNVCSLSLVLLFCPPNHAFQLLPGQETSGGMNRNMGEEIKEVLLRKE